MIWRKLIFTLFVGLLTSSALHAAGWAILPVKNWNTQALSKSIAGGPTLQGTSQELSWELAQVMRVYLSAGMITNIIPLKEVKEAYKELRYTPQMTLTPQDLKKLAALLDADNLLLTNIYGEQKQVRVESSVYYAHSQIKADLISARGASFWEVFGKVCSQRFPSFLPFTTNGEKGYDLILGIDAQGKNYRDIPHLKYALKLLSPERTAIASVDGRLNKQIFSFNSSKEKAIDFINRLSTRGSGREEQLYTDLLGSLEAMLSPGSNESSNLASSQNRRLILIVGGRPSSLRAQKRVRSYIRKLRQHTKILILGTGGLSPNAREYWVDIAAELHLKRPVHYRDIIYRQKIGLSSGHELYLFKNGASLLESNTTSLQEAHQVPLNRVRLAQLTPYNMVDLFQENSQARVISTKKVEIHVAPQIREFIAQKQKDTPQDKSVRVLVEIQKKPFWISLPKEVYYDHKNRPRLQKGQNYYILLNMLPAKMGQPFRNQTNFARILTYAQAPAILLLPVKKYLKRPETYLQKSIGNSSLYIIFARVIEIRIPSAITY